MIQILNGNHIRDEEMSGQRLLSTPSALATNQSIVAANVARQCAAGRKPPNYADQRPF